MLLLQLFFYRALISYVCSAKIAYCYLNHQKTLRHVDTVQLVLLLFAHLLFIFQPPFRGSLSLTKNLLAIVTCHCHTALLRDVLFHLRILHLPQFLLAFFNLFKNIVLCSSRSIGCCTS